MRTGFQAMRCGLIGERLGHSFSAPIHAQIADYTYELVELPPDGVGRFVKEGGFDAFNVTIPYKQTVIPFLDEISPEAERIGAVNTVVRHADGTLHGYNTDYFGFSAMLDRLGVNVRGKKALVIGAGGTSLTATCVLRDRGVSELVVVSRKDNHEDFLRQHADAEILVNTTPVGMYPNTGVSPVSLSLFSKLCAVLDVIYNPSRTALLLDAEERGIPHLNGLYMLVAQAVKAFEFFTGERAEANTIDQINAAVASDMQNIVLVGMPGCGKTTLGKNLAEQLCRPFYDADEEFLRQYGVTPAQVIQEEGEPRFREMEHEVLLGLGKESHSIIATGGGAVTREENYAPLHQNGVIVYLRRELSRLSSHGRPLSQARPIEELYLQRKDAYERFADLTVDSREIPEKTAEAVLAALAERQEC